ncbi:GDSL esterase/lipase At1g28570-like [Bidens hawaiensis]|uniref:GDSL esterase/lipase At1g28570-like n=1 Tax=Bidens hawaiensis TaxID=980011 RepID=UPI0040495ACF
MDPKWKIDMSNEYNALLEINTWELVPRPSDAPIIRCMWLYKHKFKANGSLERYKARLVVNAENLGLPLVPPYLQDNGSDYTVTFNQGVNYAVAGATTLNSPVLEPRGIVNTNTNASLGVQLAWFKQSPPSIYGNYSNCRDCIGQSLILVGEIGGNDYNFAILKGKTIEEVVAPLVPLVIDTIILAVNIRIYHNYTLLIEMGAKSLVVPRNFPIGCSAKYLTICGSKIEEYDLITGCLVHLN